MSAAAEADIIAEVVSVVVLDSASCSLSVLVGSPFAPFFFFRFCFWEVDASFGVRMYSRSSSMSFLYTCSSGGVSFAPVSWPCAHYCAVAV